MRRSCAAVAGFLLASPALAQLPAGTGSPPGQVGTFGGGFRTPGNAMVLPRPPAGGFRMVQTPPVFRAPGYFPNPGHGYVPGYGFGGGFVSGGYAPYYVVPQPVFVGGGGDAAPAAPPPGSSTVTAVSGQLPATLVVQFPAAARVWLDGVEVPGDADTDWTLTSKALRPGETATFRVRGRWASGGKTYEATREVPLGPGARTRLLVVSGTEVRE